MTIFRAAQRRAAILLAACAAALAPAGIIRVPRDQTTLQAAIDAASDGDVVIVARGVYRGPGNRDIHLRGKPLFVRSAAGPDTCVIDCQADVDNPRRGFIFDGGEGAQTVLEGFTIVNGFAPSEAFGEFFHTGAGGAILCRGAGPTIVNCVFANSRAHLGGAIALIAGSGARIERCIIRDNRAYEGGGLASYDSSPIVVDCSFLRNTSAGGGGAISTFAGEALVSNCRLQENSADEFSIGGGVLSAGGGQLTLNNCVIANNTADTTGSAIACSSSAITVSSSTIPANAVRSSATSPRWIDTPAMRRAIPRESFASWNGRVWGVDWPPLHLLAFDGTNYAPGAAYVPDQSKYKLFFNPAGVFLTSTDSGIGFLSRSPDGLADFQTKSDAMFQGFNLPRSLVYCGPTPANAGGVLLYLEYTEAPKVFASTDNGESWRPLFQCAPGSIRHFHGGFFDASLGSAGRLYLMTGDTDEESSILISDDIDEVIASPQLWRTRWGLDLADQHHINPLYTINDNLDASGAPTSQDFRAVDLLFASDGPVFWVPDSARAGGLPLIRYRPATGASERLDPVTGAGWASCETSGGELLIATSAETTDRQPRRGHDEFVHLYAFTPADTTPIEIKRWRRDGNDSVVPEQLFEAFGHLWMRTSRPVEHGARSLVGRLDSSTPRHAGAIDVSETGTLALVNSIVWNNGGTDDSQITLSDSSSVSVSYCDIEHGELGVNAPPGSVLAWGSGNIELDPLIFDPSQNAYALAPLSPCIDAGDNAALAADSADLDRDGIVNEPTPLDIAARPRQTASACVADSGSGVAPLSDIGAYEFPESADCNADGVADCFEIAGGTSADCNANGVPDECDVALRDCNADGIPDECDITLGLSADCDANGVPDECESTENDCNNNGIPDACEIADGASEDCNENFVPDECELIGFRDARPARDGTQPCPHDLSGNGQIDLADLAIMLNHFGQRCVDPLDGDVDGDRDVDLADLGGLLALFGSTCP